LFENQMRK